MPRTPIASASALITLEILTILITTHIPKFLRHLLTHTTVPFHIHTQQVLTTHTIPTRPRTRYLRPLIQQCLSRPPILIIITNLPIIMPITITGHYFRRHHYHHLLSITLARSIPIWNLTAEIKTRNSAGITTTGVTTFNLSMGPTTFLQIRRISIVNQARGKRAISRISWNKRTAS